MCHRYISDHLFHKRELIISFIEAPNIEENINAVIH